MSDSISPDAPLKQCPKCKQWKPATVQYFDRNKSRKLGLDSRCKICKSEYHQANKARFNLRMKQYRESHKEEMRLRDCQYRESHKEYLQDYEQRRRKRPEAYRQLKRQYDKDYAAYHRQYRVTHREEHRVNDRHREALKKSIPGKHTVQQIQEQLERQKYRCYYAACGHAKFQHVKGKYVYHVDHTFPISRVAGTNIPANDINYLVLTCPTCNESKGNRFPWEFPEGGRLL